MYDDIVRPLECMLASEYDEHFTHVNMYDDVRMWACANVSMNVFETYVRDHIRPWECATDKKNIYTYLPIYDVHCTYVPMYLCGMFDGHNKSVNMYFFTYCTYSVAMLGTRKQEIVDSNPDRGKKKYL